MSFFSKVGNLLGKASDFASNLIKPMKHNIQNGLQKVGNFLDRNHETIGTIASGIGNILGNLPNGQMKQKLHGASNALNAVGGYMSNYTPGTIGSNRPSNLPRSPVQRPVQQQPVQQPVQLIPQPQTQPVRQPVAQQDTVNEMSSGRRRRIAII